MTEPTPLVPVDLQARMNQVVLLGGLMSEVGAERDRARVELAQRLPSGSTFAALDPRDGETQIGQVGITKAGKEARVTDERAFAAWVIAQHPSEVDTVPVFGDPAEVAAVLADHAPHLLSSRKVIPAELRDRVLEAAVVQPIPGTTVVATGSTPWAKPNDAGREIVREALASATVLQIGAGQ